MKNPLALCRYGATLLLLGLAATLRADAAASVNSGAITWQASGTFLKSRTTTEATHL